MKKIIFVNFYVKQISRFPLGTAYLIGAVREKTDYLPILYDENYYIHKKKKTSKGCMGLFKDIIIEQKPDYVAFTLYQDNIKFFLKYARLIKSKLPLCKIIVGGVYPTLMGEHLIKNIKEIDILVLKEGELVLSQILNSTNLKEIPNLIYKENKRIIKTKEIFNYNFDIDKIPKPSREDFDMQLYSKNISLFFRMKPTLTMLLSRGCTGKCSFCVSNKIYEKFRVRNPENVIKEIYDIINKYPYIKNIYFTDNCFNLNHPKVEKFLNLFTKEKFNKKLSFGIQTRLEFINAKTVELLKKNNCNYTGVGLESFSPAVQKSMNKPFSLTNFKRKNELLNKAGLFVVYYFIFNYPHMSFKDVIGDIKKIEYYNLYVSISYFRPVPNTKSYQELVKRGSLPNLKCKKINWHSDFISEFSKQKFWDLNQNQEKIIKNHIQKISKQNFWRWFFRINSKDKLRYIYIKTRFNPFKLAKSLLKNILFLSL